MSTYIKTVFPDGFFERHITGPCNNALCGHPDCPVMREELRQFGEKLLQRAVRHTARRRLVRR